MSGTGGLKGRFASLHVFQWKNCALSSVIATSLVSDGWSSPSVTEQRKSFVNAAVDPRWEDSFKSFSDQVSFRPALLGGEESLGRCTAGIKKLLLASGEASLDYKVGKQYMQTPRYISTGFC
jgi:hypothetical protein